MLRTFHECLEAAQSFYRDNLRAPLQFPNLHLHVSDAHQVNYSFPSGAVAFNASVMYADKDEDAKWTQVTLKVMAQEVDYDCLLALPYILMHELFCHWPQMSRGASPRCNPALLGDPTNVDARRVDSDPFSEGWMDRLVGDALERREIDGSDPGAWRRMQAEIGAARRIHADRTDRRSGQSYAAAQFISAGEVAAHWVEWLYDGDGTPRELTGRDLARLSCELNVADWTFEQRRDGCHGIIKACEAYMRAGRQADVLDVAHQAVIGALRAFRDSRDIGALLAALSARYSQTCLGNRRYG
jgi:hypothetical protein